MYMSFAFLNYVNPLAGPCDTYQDVDYKKPNGNASNDYVNCSLTNRTTRLPFCEKKCGITATNKTPNCSKCMDNCLFKLNANEVTKSTNLCGNYGGKKSKRNKNKMRKTRKTRKTRKSRNTRKTRKN